MNELCVPLPVLSDDQVAEVTVTVGGRNESFNFRVESFAWMPSPAGSEAVSDLLLTEQKVSSLKESIEGYDKNWELIQIYTPRPDADHIQVLFRQK